MTIFPKKPFFKILTLSVIIVLYFIPVGKNNLITFDTKYHKVTIINTIDINNKQPLRLLRLDAETSSGIYLNSNKLAIDYTRFYDLITKFNPGFKNSLMIGGGGFVYPMHYINSYKTSSIDVVEIDSDLTPISKKYFGLKDNPRLRIINEDGREFINKTSNKYDNILIDAFSSYYSVPYQLTTKETVKTIYSMLNNNGVVILNLISSLEGDNSKFFESEYKTYKSIFPYVTAVQVNPGTDKQKAQNIILIASKSTNKIALKNEFVPDSDELTKAPILTDNFAPVDQYINAFLK